MRTPFLRRLVAKTRRGQPDGRTIDESLIEVIKFRAADPAAVGEHELSHMRTIPASESGINRIGKLTESMGTGRREDPPDQIHPNRQPRTRHD